MSRCTTVCSPLSCSDLTSCSSIWHRSISRSSAGLEDTSVFVGIFMAKTSSSFSFGAVYLLLTTILLLHQLRPTLTLFCGYGVNVASSVISIDVDVAWWWCERDTHLSGRVWEEVLWRSLYWHVLLCVYYCDLWKHFFSSVNRLLQPSTRLQPIATVGN